MITCTQRKGRTGNRLFQLASLIGLAEKYGHELRLPKNDVWDILKYFDVHIPEFNGRVNKHIIEPKFHYDPEFFEMELAEKEKVIDVAGWLQTEKYFSKNNKLRFKPEYMQDIWHKHGLKRKSIAISVRRGDFVFNPNYYQLPVKYYIGALIENFPDWREHDLVFFSDDPDYIKIHFECLDNAFFPKLDPIDQLCLGSQCDNFIISNSTFSWWMAYMNENEENKTIRPLRNFDGPLAKAHKEEDYWPERWQIFNHEDYKINLKDATFTVPVAFDHNDRKQNLELTTCLIQQVFDTNIILMEQGGNRFEYMSEWVKYMKFGGNEFHRTKMLNDMAIMAETPIVINWDCDNVIAPMQIIESVEMVRAGADMVYPFDGQSARVPRQWFSKIEKYLDAGILQERFRGMNKYDSVGHAIVFNMDSFASGGMENERMISWGPEDIERYERFTRLGFRVEKARGPVYHLDHYVGRDSSSNNPHYEENWNELKKQRAMTNDALRQYVSTWEWAHPYTSSYYETIIEDAVRSRDEVFKVLISEYQLNSVDVIDVGCGLGEWGKDIEKHGVKKYIGIDFGVMQERLLFPKENYIDLDLTKNDMTIYDKFDLAMCLEVAEHLPEEVSPDIIKFLCSLSDYVLFSAAIPYQPGVKHINCQWQTWWENMFNENGYYASELPIKDLLKGNKNVSIWYRQNIVLYSKHFRGKTEDYIEPQMFENIINHLKQAA